MLVTVFSNKTADEVVEVFTGSATLASLDLTLNGTSSIQHWRGLTLEADASRSEVTIKGDPNVERDYITVMVNGRSDKGANLGSANLIIEIVPPNSHALTLTPSSLHPIKDEPFIKDIEVSTTPAISLTDLKIDGQTTVDWNGLKVDVANGFNIRVSGTPEAVTSKSFVVTGTAVDPIRATLLTISVHEPDQVSRQRSSGEHINIEEGSYSSEIEVRKRSVITLKCWGSIMVDSVVGIDPDGRQEWLDGPSSGLVSKINVNVYPTETGLYTLRINYTRSNTAYYQLAPYRAVRAESDEEEGSSGCQTIGAGMVVLTLWVCMKLLRKKR
jgi:hypothetical protein